MLQVNIAELDWWISQSRWKPVKSSESIAKREWWWRSWGWFWPAISWVSLGLIFNRWWVFEKAFKAHELWSRVCYGNDAREIYSDSGLIWANTYPRSKLTSKLIPRPGRIEMRWEATRFSNKLDERILCLLWPTIW